MQSQISSSNLEHILYLATRAPSADNNQPWALQIRGDQVDLKMAAGRQLAHMPLQFFDYVSLGALLENLQQAAGLCGYRAEIEYQDEDQKTDKIASIKFHQQDQIESELGAYIEKRQTTRTAYKKQAVPHDILRCMSAACTEFGCTLVEISERSAVNKFANALAALEPVRLRIRELHHELMKFMRFSDREVLNSGDGLAVKTLNLPPGSASLLRLNKNWTVSKILHKFGFGLGTYLHGLLQLRQTGSFVAIIPPTDNQRGYIQAGLALERTWLLATKHGLAVHPCGAWPVFARMLQQSDCCLAEKDRKAVQRVNETYRQLIGSASSIASTALPAIVLRLGYSKKKAARSVRLPLAQVVAGFTAQSEINESFNYAKAFRRNSGLIHPLEQEKLKHATVAIPGLGGVGGIHLVTLARLGVGGFHLADGDTYSMSNINRQYGATSATLGLRKSEIMKQRALDINPDLRLRIWPDYLDQDSIEQFLTGCDLVVDSLDAFAYDTRSLLHRIARQLGIPVIIAGPIGFSCSMLVFTPESMSFAEYFNIKPDMSKEDKLAHFVTGTTPGLEPISYTNIETVKVQRMEGPSVASSVTLCAGFAAVEALKLLLNRGRVSVAPHYHYFDPYIMKFKRRYLLFGNKNPLQRLKIKYFSYCLRKKKLSCLSSLELTEKTVSKHS